MIRPNPKLSHIVVGMDRSISADGHKYVGLIRPLTTDSGSLTESSKWINSVSV